MRFITDYSYTKWKVTVIVHILAKKANNRQGNFMAPRISLCMIVKNEEKNLRRCLGSAIGAVDEIIVVDTGSTDNTVRVATEFGAQVYFFPWNGNFSDARNASLERATGEWILVLDADEELTAEGREVLRRVVQEGCTDGVEGYFVKIINYLGEEGWVETCPDLVFRLFKNRSDYRFRGAVHEQIADVILEKNPRARYKVAESLTILHYGYLEEQIQEKDKKNRNLSIIRQEVEQNPKNRLLRYHYGVELFRIGRHEEAAAELLRAAEGADPGAVYLPKLYRYLALAYQAAGRYPEALQAIQKGIDLFPDYADLYYYGGLVCLQTKRYARAYELFNRALSLPEPPVYYAPFAGTRGFRSYFHLGQLAEAFLNEEEAMRYYILSLRDNTSFTPALESIARLLRPQEDPAYAKRCLETLCDFCTPEANLLIGQILFRLGAFRLALEYLEKGTKGQQVKPEVLLWKAICLMQQERFLEALRLLDGFGPGHRLYALARLNKLLCFWFQGNRRKVRPLVRELLALGLSSQTSAVIRMLDGSLHRRKGPPVFLEEEGMSLLLEIIMRALDLGRHERVEALLECLAEECRGKCARPLGRLFLRYGCLNHAERYLALDLEVSGESAETFFLLGEVKEARGEYHEAQGFYRRASLLEPGEPKHYIKLMRCYENLRKGILQSIPEGYLAALDAQGNHG